MIIHMSKKIIELIYKKYLHPFKLRDTTNSQKTKVVSKSLTKK